MRVPLVSLTILLVGNLAAAITSLFAGIGPEWAIPANTALLVILAVINGWIGRRAARNERRLADVQKKIGADRRNSDPHGSSRER